MSNEQSNEVPPTLEGYDMTNVVPFDPDYRAKNSTTPTEINERDPLVMARLVSDQTGIPYKEILIDLYNTVVDVMDDSGDNPELFLELLADADVIKEELIREGVL
jgi:hypothetical protein